MRKTIIFFVSIFLFFCVSGCQFLRDHKAWNKAVVDNTFSSYSDYIGEFPKGIQAREARQQILIRYRMVDSELNSILNGGEYSYSEQELLTKLVLIASDCLYNSGSWSNERLGRRIYNFLQAYQPYFVSKAISRAVLIKINRQRVLIFAVKLGKDGTEEDLNRILYKYGDKSMAEDYLNCGSRTLYNGGREWARRRGYNVQTGFGSHRAAWGKF